MILGTSLSFSQKLADIDTRAHETERVCRDPNKDERTKRRIRMEAARGEALYLRHLRTNENPQNFNTIKIIGKGAFGEVKLVRKKDNDSIYALKSLVKSEMVSALLWMDCQRLTRLLKVQTRPAGPCAS